MIQIQDLENNKDTKVESNQESNITKTIEANQDDETSDKEESTTIGNLSTIIKTSKSDSSQTNSSSKEIKKKERKVIDIFITDPRLSTYYGINFPSHKGYKIRIPSTP